MEKEAGRGELYKRQTVNRIEYSKQRKLKFKLKLQLQLFCCTDCFSAPDGRVLKHWFLKVHH